MSVNSFMVFRGRMTEDVVTYSLLNSGTGSLTFPENLDWRFVAKDMMVAAWISPECYNAGVDGIDFRNWELFFCVKMKEIWR